MAEYSLLKVADSEPVDLDHRAQHRPIRFPLERACDFEPPTADDWLIKGLIPKEGVGTLFGESGHYKSFTALHIALHIATGEPWAGRKSGTAALSSTSPQKARGALRSAYKASSALTTLTTRRSTRSASPSISGHQTSMRRR
jgi:hypothetical protein